MTTSILCGVYLRRQSCNCQRKWCHVILQLSTYSLIMLLVTNLNFRRCVKIKYLVGLYNTAHNSIKQRHWKDIHNHFKKIIIYDYKRETERHGSENAVGRGTLYVWTCTEQYGNYRKYGEPIWKFSVEINQILYVCSQFLDVSHTSLKGKRLGYN